MTHTHANIYICTYIHIIHTKSRARKGDEVNGFSHCNETLFESNVYTYTFIRIKWQRKCEIEKEEEEEEDGEKKYNLLMQKEKIY